MPPRSPRTRITRVEIVAALANWTLSIVTTMALAAVGWFGHATHWTFGLAGHDAAHAPTAHAEAEPEQTAAEGELPAGTADAVRFQSKEAVERTGIQLVPVEARPMVSELVASGVVQYDQRHIAQLSARVPGSVWRVEKHLGDTVKKGDVLLVIESREVGKLKADFLNALVAHEARSEQLAILEEVKGAVMGRQLREAKSALREARNHLTIAEQALVNLGLNVSIADYEPLDDSARAARIRTAGLPSALLAAIDSDRVTSNLLPLYAPFDGVVIGRDAVVGEVIDPTAAIFEVADVSTMWVVLNISKEDASRVAIGQRVRFRPDGSSEDYQSKVAWISTEVNEETRTLEVRAEIANMSDAAVAASAAGRPASAVLRANTFGNGRIEVDHRGAALVVPLSSVQWDGSRWVVFVPAGETAFAARAVRPGVQQGDSVEIVGDFAGGTPPTHVVGAGSHVLKSQILLDRMEAGEL
ncbi:MAG: efflux RND transporter periplasmic adaptor subunit [Planctomycetia bacterium]|nr:efflux RND transporter periplasmic adaptor subunit [Planctomycetia bacterium]